MLATASALGTRLLPFAMKGARAIFEHIKEHHDEKAAAKGGLVPHQLNLTNAIDMLKHPELAKDTMKKILLSKAGSMLTNSGILTKYMNMRQLTPALLGQLSKAVKQGPSVKANDIKNSE